jgi:hypothetical protein
MALVVKDRVRETTTSTGTGTITLAGAVAGYQSFSVIGNANTTYYTIVDSTNNTWEVGVGTYTSSGTTLSRDTVLESSTGGAKIDFAAGTKDVFVTYPAERAVDTEIVQTLTNKTISVDDNTVSGIAASSFVLSNGSGNIDGAAAQKAIPSGAVVGTTDTQTLSGKTITNLVFDGDYTEEVFTISDGGSVDLDPSNGTIQLWTLGASRSPTANSFSAGQSMTLMIDDGTAYTITWPSVTWRNNGGVAPTLATTGYTVIVLWKVSTTLYGVLVGNGT